MAEMTTPILFMKQLMYKLQYTYDNEQNKLNLALADLTDIDGLVQITDWAQLRDMIKADITTNLNNGGDGKKFLKDYCNIDLDNEDCGALIGFDCSGGDILTNDNIIEETGELQTHPSSAVIGGCTITFPTFSDSKYNYVMDGLYTWWIGLPFNLVKESFGLEFNSDSFVNSMPVDLYNDPPSGGLVTGAYVTSTYSLTTFQTSSLTLKVNMNDAAFGTIIIGDKSGNTTGGRFAALDRVLAHELTHAVMSTNIRGFNAWLPSWFNEGGTAELVNGCDDSRTSALLGAAVSTSIIDDGFSSSPSNANEYSVGFIAMRYLLKKYTDRQQKIIFPVKPKEPFEKVWEKMAHGIRSEHCVSRDGDLNKIMDEFVDFCQRDDYNLVQPWTLCVNTGSKTLRIPLEGHEPKVEDEICNFRSSMPAGSFFNCTDAVTISDDLCTMGISFGESFDTTKLGLFTLPMYNFNGRSNPSGYGELGVDFDVFIYFSHSGFILEDTTLFQWCCDSVNLYKNGINSYNVDEAFGEATNLLLQKYYAAVRSTQGLRKNICVAISGATLPLYRRNIHTLDVFVDAVKRHNGVVRLYLLACNDFGSIVPSDTTAFLQDFNDMLDRLAALNVDMNKIEVNLDYYYYVKDIPRETYLSPYFTISFGGEGTKTWDFGTTCSVNEHRYIFEDTRILEHDIHLLVNGMIKVDNPKFIVKQKTDTDFPCFYLSTGVFKPSTWNGQGLTYPSSAVSNVNDEYIPFNIHILNDYRMRFDLQGMGTCKKVTGKQGDADILNGIRQTGQYSYEADKISDLIPGIGCPLIVRSVENKAIYNTILCYFTKTDYSGTFTLIFYDEHDEEKPPVFQSVAFGLGITEEESYKYPLYTAGGTSGLYPAHYSFSYMPGPMAREPVTLHIYGNEFNFDMEKGDTLDSLLYPVATNRCGISNFRVLQSDGRWKSVINLRQVFYQGGDNTCGAYITKNNGNNVKDYLVYPTISDATSVDRYTLVQPITVIKKHIDGEDESGFLMSINGVKCKPDRLRSMFSALDGHEYLIVPNGWYDRTLGLPLINSMSITEIMDLIQKMPKQTYVLCVDLG